MKWFIRCHWALMNTPEGWFYCFFILFLLSQLGTFANVTIPCCSKSYCLNISTHFCITHISFFLDFAFICEIWFYFFWHYLWLFIFISLSLSEQVEVPDETLVFGFFLLWNWTLKYSCVFLLWMNSVEHVNNVICHWFDLYGMFHSWPLCSS